MINVQLTHFILIKEIFHNNRIKEQMWITDCLCFWSSMFSMFYILYRLICQISSLLIKSWIVIISTVVLNHLKLLLIIFTWFIKRCIGWLKNYIYWVLELSFVYVQQFFVVGNLRGFRWKLFCADFHRFPNFRQL